jgi:hypothetical protein
VCFIRQTRFQVSARTKHGLCPLHLAVGGRGDPETVQVRPNRSVIRLPLRVCISHFTVTQQVLSDFGADLEARADANWTALHFAAFLTRARKAQHVNCHVSVAIKYSYLMEIISWSISMTSFLCFVTGQCIAWSSSAQTQRLSALEDSQLQI